MMVARSGPAAPRGLAWPDTPRSAGPYPRPTPRACELSERAIDARKLPIERAHRFQCRRDATRSPRSWPLARRSITKMATAPSVSSACTAAESAGRAGVERHVSHAGRQTRVVADRPLGRDSRTGSRSDRRSLTPAVGRDPERDMPHAPLDVLVRDRHGHAPSRLYCMAAGRSYWAIASKKSVLSVPGVNICSD